MKIHLGAKIQSQSHLLIHMAVNLLRTGQMHPNYSTDITPTKRRLRLQLWIIMRPTREIERLKVFINGNLVIIYFLTEWILASDIFRVAISDHYSN